MQYYFRGFGILVIVLILMTLVFINIPRIKRLNNIRKRLKCESEYIKKRKNELYKIIKYDTVYRKKYYNYLLIACAASILVFLLSWFVLMKREDHSIIVLFLFLGCGFAIYKIITEYSKGFKENVLKQVILAYKQDIEYVSNDGFKQDEYKSLNFPERYNKFSSEDLYVDKSSGVTISNILVENDTSDTDNNIGVVLIFDGSLSRCDVNNTNSKLLIGNVKQLIALDDKDKVVKIGNEEFNKYYSLCTSNIDLVKKVLTDDIISMLINLKKNLYGNIDIRIINDKIYVRFNGADGFRPNLVSMNMEMHSVLTSIIVFDEITKLCLALRSKINSSEVNSNYEVL